jgi:hypothetical protein
VRERDRGPLTEQQQLWILGMLLGGILAWMTVYVFSVSPIVLADVSVLIALTTALSIRVVIRTGRRPMPRSDLRVGQVTAVQRHLNAVEAPRLDPAEVPVQHEQDPPADAMNHRAGRQADQPHAVVADH